jgi:hypothetical protein
MPNPTDHDTRDGAILGLTAYASVAAFYALFDGLATRGPLYTVNLLGRAAFRGLRDPSVLQFPVAIDMSAVLLYNALHLICSLVIGLIVVRLVSRAERTPSQAWPMFLIIVAGFVATVVGVGLLSAPIRVVLPWWSIVVANASAVVVGAFFLSRRRPGVVGRVVPLLH